MCVCVNTHVRIYLRVGEFAWLFFDNPLSDMDPKIDELRSTPLPPRRTGTPQLIFATGMSVKAGETNVTRLPGSVTFIRCEWREKSTLFTKEAYKRHHVHPALLSEMLGDRPGLWAWVVDPKLSMHSPAVNDWQRRHFCCPHIRPRAKCGFHNVRAATT